MLMACYPVAFESVFTSALPSERSVPDLGCYYRHGPAVQRGLDILRLQASVPEAQHSKCFRMG